MKITMWLVLSLSALIPSLACAANWQAPQCAACTLPVPIPDATTAAWLDAYGVPNINHTNSVNFSAGDTVGVCNESVCATYTRTDDNQYNKGTEVPETTPGNPNQCH